MKVNQTIGNVTPPKSTPEPLAIVGGTGGAGGAGGPGRPGGTGSSDGPIKTSTTILANVQRAIDAEPEIRTELVEKYEELVKSGEYKIDSDKLASKLIFDSLVEDVS